MAVEPFPHWTFDGLWPDDLLDRVEAEFPPLTDQRWVRYDNDRELKQEGNRRVLGPDTPATVAMLNALASQDALDWLGRLTGIDGLSCEIEGGGMHQIPPGGKLGVHADFNRSRVTGRWRRVNLLVYLNRGWDDAWGGHLELHDDTGCVRTIAPVFNRTVVFVTSERSWHGHPRPLACPPDRCRRSIAAYYFTDAPAEQVGEHSTVWKEG